MDQVTEGVGVLKRRHQIDLYHNKEQQIEHTNQHPHTPRINPNLLLIRCHQRHINHRQDRNLQNGLKQIQTEVDQGEHAFHDRGGSFFIIEPDGEQHHDQEGDEHEGENTDTDGEEDVGVLLDEVVDADVVDHQLGVLEDRGGPLPAGLVAEGEVDYLQGLYQPEECKRDFVDLDVLEQLVG